MTSVYVGLSADPLSHGHINILEKARSLGVVTVGLLTDSAIAKRKRLPALNFDQRKQIISNLKGVERVVPQDDWDYSPNLLSIKPDFFVHGDDWIVGPESRLRNRVIAALESYGGRLVEIPFTSDDPFKTEEEKGFSQGISPSRRARMLRELLEVKPLSRFIEVHSPLAGLVAEMATYDHGDQIARFDGFWSSSLTDSTLLGRPDTEVVGLSQRLSHVGELFEVTSLPLIFDADTGGQSEHFEINVQTIERIGVSAVIIEDKKGLKRNSLFGNEVFQELENPADFARKIEAGRKAVGSPDFQIVARLESLILEAGVEDALMRADLYLEAGADAIMIHSREKTPQEVFDFTRKFRKKDQNTPIVVVPTSYSEVRESELEAEGINVVIYANHMLRAVYPALTSAAESILKHRRSKELESQIAPVDLLLSLIPGTRN